MDVKVFGISTDNTPSQAEFAKKNNVEVPMLSDFKDRAVSKSYGVLIESAGMANRATFVVDKEGKIVSIEEGNTAVDPTGAVTACTRASHK
jgi:peroxiredoxin